jgi:hypothetical protein
MRMKIGALAAVAGIALALGASASRAAIVEVIIDSSSDAVVGGITFPTFTGGSDAGVLFSYGGFTQADITSISWTLDPTTDAVIALDLNALQGDNPCPNGTPDCSNSTLNLSPTLATGGGKSCHFSGEIGFCSEFESIEPIAFVPAPELSTWAMMVVGLVGLISRRAIRLWQSPSSAVSALGRARIVQRVHIGFAQR